jgi:hypothetical protein
MQIRHVLIAFALAGCAGSASLSTEVSDSSAAEVDAADAKADAAHRNLTTAQQKAVLTQLDNICGDTWCDGDWSFDFKKIVCKLDLGTCTWTALITPSVPATEKLVFWRSCKVSGVHQFSDLVTTTNGYQSLNEDYYMASTDCVQKIESHLPTYTPAE